MSINKKGCDFVLDIDMYIGFNLFFLFLSIRRGEWIIFVFFLKKKVEKKYVFILVKENICWGRLLKGWEGFD